MQDPTVGAHPESSAPSDFVALKQTACVASMHGPTSWPDYTAMIGELATRHARSWSNDLVEAPDRLARHVADLLVVMRLAQMITIQHGLVLQL